MNQQHFLEHHISKRAKEVADILREHSLEEQVAIDIASAEAGRVLRIEEAKRKCEERRKKRNTEQPSAPVE